jgi:NAD(P)H dehydrogenase (quinone)
MTTVVIAYHSGYGHTKRMADFIQTGASQVLNTVVMMIPVDKIDDKGWAALNAADAIIFGAPTYMGGASGPFKVFADASSKAWFSGAWSNKIAGGFTCSLSMSGDKLSTLQYFVTLAMQQNMIWVGTGLPSSQKPGAPDTVNRLGSSIGVMAQADNVPPDQSPPSGDLETARLYGVRIAEYAKKLRG